MFVCVCVIITIITHTHAHTHINKAALLSHESLVNKQTLEKTKGQISCKMRCLSELQRNSLRNDFIEMFYVGYHVMWAYYYIEDSNSRDSKYYNANL